MATQVPQLSLTPQARRVLHFAHQEAIELDHAYIGTEHLLLGIVRERDGLAARILYELGVDADLVRRKVRQALGQQPRPRQRWTLTLPLWVGELIRPARLRQEWDARELTKRSIRSFELARAEARHAHADAIDTEHLLLGLLGEGGGLAAQVLDNAGVNIERVREQMKGMV
jgi:ATP-dependent Clp protease ATP-binding subunit ClpC